MVYETAKAKVIILIEPKSRVHQILGFRGDPVVAFYELLTTKQMGCSPAEAGRANKMERSFEMYIPLIEGL